MIEILENGIAISRPDQMYGWPGITRAANGDILIAASERKFHVCPFGREVVVRSADNGRSWSLPQEVYDSELDDRDANLLTMPDGTIILSWFTSTAFAGEPWEGRTARVTERMRDELIGSWFIRSSDHGKTWEKQARRMPTGMHISPVLLSDGSLISIGFEDRLMEKRRLCAYKSFDGGETWTEAAKIGDESMMLNENHVLDVGNGRLIGLFRKCNDCLRQAVSDDYGQTWSTPEPTGIKGYPAQMIKLHNGDILCVYGHRWQPYSIRGVLSHDNGTSWDIENTFTIYEWEDKPDMGYPSSLEIEPGEILTVFYCSRRGVVPWHEAVQPEGILYTRYRLKI
jgi:hypothetical protein